MAEALAVLDALGHNAAVLILFLLPGVPDAPGAAHRIILPLAVAVLSTSLTRLRSFAPRARGSGQGRGAGGAPPPRGRADPGRMRWPRDDPVALLRLAPPPRAPSPPPTPPRAPAPGRRAGLPAHGTVGPAGEARWVL
jgi:hypothetical protein